MSSHHKPESDAEEQTRRNEGGGNNVNDRSLGASAVEPHELLQTAGIPGVVDNVCGSPPIIRQNSLEAESPSHTGLLREEVLVLRGVLGYVDFIDETTNLRIPQIGTHLFGSSMKDLLLVGLDIDTFQGYEQIAPDQQLHIGISVLDTRKLHTWLLTQETNAPDSMIESYQYTVGSSKYCSRASMNFMFGQSEGIQLSQIRPRLQELVQGRDYTFILHGSSSDIKMLDNLDINLASSGCLYVFDTNKVAQWALQLSYRLGLEKLLERLEIPFDDLHAAGNDAHFSLRAFLMLAVKDAERLRDLYGCLTNDNVLRVIGQIAQAPRPISRSEKLRQQDQVFIERKLEREENRKLRRLARKERRREKLEARAQESVGFDASREQGSDHAMSPNACTIDELSMQNSGIKIHDLA